MCQVYQNNFRKEIFGYAWECCHCSYGPLNIHTDLSCPNCEHWRCEVWRPMQETVTGPNTPESLRVMMAVVDNPPLEIVSTRAQSILSAPSELIKLGELNQPDTSCHQHVSDEARGESLCLEDNKYPSNQIGCQEPVNSTEADEAMFDKITTLYENDESASRSLSEDSEVSENQLPQQEQQWFHQNLEYIIGELLQEWQGFKNQTHDRHFGKSNYNGKNDSPPNNQVSKDSQKRKQDPETDDQESTSGPSFITRRQRGAGNHSMEPPLACPFSKMDLHVYRECTRFGFKRARDVKQHLKRNHRPDVEEARRIRLQRPSSRGTREQQWYEVFDILFPGHLPRPCSPYNDFEISQQPPAVATALDEVLHLPYQYLMTEGAGILLQEIQRDPAFSRDGGPNINDMRRALGRLFGQYLSQRLGRPLEAPNGSDGTPEESLRSNPDTSQEGLILESGRTSTLVSESPDNSPSNQPNMPHYLDQQNGSAGDELGTEHLVESDNGNTISSSQAGEVLRQDLDTLTASNDEEALLCVFEEIEQEINSDFIFDDFLSYSEEP